MVHIRGHLTEAEWAWLKTMLTNEQYLGGKDSSEILKKISTNEEARHGKLGIVALQGRRV